MKRRGFLGLLLTAPLVKAGAPEPKALLFPKGSLAPPAYSFVNDTDAAIYRMGAEKLTIIAGGAHYWAPAYDN